MVYQIFMILYNTKMYKIIILSCCSLLVSFVATKDEYFNILSLDGGGIRGLITAQVVEYMEN
jgi:hypothetical protein